MSEQAPEPLTPEQETELAQQAAEHVAAQPNPAADQAASMAQITERGPLLPAEAAMDELMAAFKAQSKQIEALQGQVSAMRTQQEQALAAQGGPLATRYATAVADKAAAVVAAHPDAPEGHFKPLVEAAGKLAEAAAGAVKGTSGAVGEVKDAAAAVERFATRLHARGWAKSIDWSALLDDAETAVAEAVKLAA